MTNEIRLSLMFVSHYLAWKPFEAVLQEGEIQQGCLISISLVVMSGPFKYHGADPEREPAYLGTCNCQIISRVIPLVIPSPGTPVVQLNYIHGPGITYRAVTGEVWQNSLSSKDPFKVNSLLVQSVCQYYVIVRINYQIIFMWAAPSFDDDRGAHLEKDYRYIGFPYCTV